MKRGYRADIQGLRALAVLMVIAFHAQLPVPGGFVGVDVFFVISGFVITSMLMREWQLTGAISLREFYLRRIKRLTPAVALLVAVTAILATLFLSPYDQQDVAAKTGLGALALVANWVIAAQPGGYFDPAAERNPLLHTWSLSVEEQFYLAFPLLLLLAWRLGRRLGRPHTTALVVVSLAALASLAMIRGGSLGIPHDSWLIGYYSPLTRAWEFAAGALLALIAHHLPRNRALGFGTGVMGLLLLVASVVLINGETPFPGKWTLVPVAGAVLAMAAGVFDESNPVSRALATRPMVKVGDWSYSLYLWHWPLIVVALALFPNYPWAPVVAAVLCFAPAVASYRWVEDPLRRMQTAPLRLYLARMGAIVTSSAVLAAGGWLVALHVWQPAYDDGRIWTAHPVSAEEAKVRELPAAPGHTCPWPELAVYIGTNGQCRQSSESRPVDVVVLGDSHAQHLAIGLMETMPKSNVAVTSFLSPQLFGGRPGIDLAIDSILSEPAPPAVLISRYWTRGPVGGYPPYELVEYAVGRLTSAGAQVVLLDDVPDFPFPVTACSHRLAPVVGTAVCDTPRSNFDEARDAYVPDLVAIAARHPGASVLEVGDAFCSETTCSMLVDGEVAYGDSDHLNHLGSQVLAGQIVPQLSGRNGSPDRPGATGVGSDG